MIIDSSALLAIVLGEPDAEQYLSAMTSATELAIGAATLAETMIVAGARQGDEAVSDVAELLAELQCDVISFDEEQAQLAYRAWRRFGKGRHPASLNFGDCLAYAVASSFGRPLLFKGEDFPQSDIAAVPL